MKLRIDETIRKYRKSMGLTQEQLAEAMGVTIGAVSKWESGLSNPDIKMLPVLADFFGISVDVLLDYRLQVRNAELASEKIRELSVAKRFEEGQTEADRALSRFPNSFDVVYQSAKLFYRKALEKGCHAEAKKALELYERACALISQNTDESISELSIQQSIGDVYYLMGDKERALNHFKKNNFQGVNNAMIGFVLAQMDRYTEALPYLSESLLEGVLKLFRTAIGLANCYGNEDPEGKNSAIELLLWIHSVLQGLKETGKSSYFNKIDAILFSGCAQLAAETDNEIKTEEYLRQALKAAKTFDATPEYDTAGIRFYRGKTQSIGDDFGETAMQGVEKTLSAYEHIEPILMKIWRKILHEET